MIVEIEYADSYFSTRLGASAFWSSGTEKTAALQTAENDLAGVYGTLLETDTVRNAICEQALFRLQGGTGLERRASLQAQGVTAAGVVKESYRQRPGTIIPISPYAQTLMGSASVTAVGIDMKESS